MVTIDAPDVSPAAISCALASFTDLLGEDRVLIASEQHGRDARQPYIVALIPVNARSFVPGKLGYGEYRAHLGGCAPPVTATDVQRLLTRAASGSCASVLANYGSS